MARVKPLSTGNQSWSVLACSSRVGVCIGLSVRLDWCPSKSAGSWRHATHHRQPSTPHTLLVHPRRLKTRLPLACPPPRDP